MNESTPKPKSTEVRRVRRGVVLHRTALALPPELVTAFRVECMRRNSCMSSTVERWIAEYLASLSPAAALLASSKAAE